MKNEETLVKGVRLKQTTWNDLQEIADEQEMGNLNHLLNKVLTSFLKSVGKKKKK